MQVYPNPITDEFTLNIEAVTAEKLTVVISTVTGKIIRTQSITVVAGQNPIPFNLEGARSGIYLVQVRGQQLNLVQRIVKQ